MILGSLFKGFCGPSYVPKQHAARTPPGRALLPGLCIVVKIGRKRWASPRLSPEGKRIFVDRGSRHFIKR